MCSLGNSNLGLDPAAVASQSSTIHSHAGMLNGIAAEIGRTGEASRAPGLFGLLPGNLVMTAGSIFLAQSAEADVRAAAAAATDLLGRLSAAIEEQEFASSATDGYTNGAMSAGPATDLYDRVMANPDALNDMTPGAVKSWFDGLTPAQQDAFVTEHPEIAGNTNGIPFDRRIEANVLNAKEDLANGATGDQKDYLEKVVAGDVTLISYSPKDDRIIEMVGEYYPEDVYVDGVLVHPRTDDIINYVPGTNADMNGFYKEETQDLARAIVDGANPPGATVAFVYKDSPFPTFNPLTGVANNDWSESVGEAYHEFNNALTLENTGGASVTSIEHSFGSSAGGNAEIRGTHFDNRIVLAGIGMTDDWTAGKDTAYYSFTGQSDAIRAVRDVQVEGLGYGVPPTTENGFTEIDTGFAAAPDNWEVPDVSVKTPWGDIEIPVDISIPTPIESAQDRIDQHSRITRTNEENQVNVDKMIAIIERTGR
jgi:hypothetical protein